MQVFLWDQRAKRAPQAYLLPMSKSSGAVRSVVTAADGQAIIAGTQSGEVCMILSGLDPGVQAGHALCLHLPRALPQPH